MREIKCRGKDEEGQWHYGYYVFTNDMHRIIYEDRECFYVEEEVIPETVGQYTGIKDNNANEIYEGDIVKCHNGLIYIVDWHKEDAMFYYKDSYGDKDDDLLMRAVSFQVIGNIHDNPELLKNSTK